MQDRTTKFRSPSLLHDQNTANPFARYTEDAGLEITVDSAVALRTCETGNAGPKLH